MQNLAEINASIHAALPSSPTPQHIPPQILQALMYALQGIDAHKSAQLFKHTGTYETNPLMRPFSHGGFPTMALGFGLDDLIRNALMRHASQGARNTADILQALTNIQGIMQTNHAVHILTHLIPHIR